MATASAQLYTLLNSNVILINSGNFDSQITKKRDKYTSLVHYYKESDGRSFEIAEVIKEFSKNWQGVYIISGVDCQAQAALCEKEQIREEPTLKIYPPFPIPAFDYEGEHSVAAINKQMAKYIPSRNIVEISSEGIDAYIKDKPSVPKCLLFTDKKGTPTLIKALANSMEGKIFFGIARADDEALAKKYNVSKYPTILLVKASEKKPFVYSGEMKYSDIYDYLNIHAETFVPGGQDESAATKSWMTETVPELHRLSADDICLKADNLCVIYFGQAKPEDPLHSDLKDVSKRLMSAIDRGASVKFMWLNINEEPDFFKAFDISETPAIAVMKTGKRSRFIMHEGAMTGDAIEQTLNNILGGDGKFTNIKGGLPDFAFRKI